MAETDLDRLDRAIVNAFQGGFPVAEEPFETAAGTLREHGVDIDASDLAERIHSLDERDVLSRFGPLVNATAIGGATTLVAMDVPEDRFEAVAETVNDHREVAHNYERDHGLNMWFVLSVVDTNRIDEVLEAIEAETGLETYNLPKLQEFDLGAEFLVDGPLAETAIDCTGIERNPTDTEALSDAERDLLLAVQDGFPSTTRPYATVAEELGVSSQWVLETTERFLENGTFRRIGVIPNHYALGFTENPMTVWDVPDEDIDTVGAEVGAHPFVTHCYERPRHGDRWPYNLFAMVHGRTTEEATGRVRRVRNVVETHSTVVDTDTLHSTRILKKTGLRLAARTENAGSA